MEYFLRKKCYVTILIYGCIQFNKMEKKLKCSNFVLKSDSMQLLDISI